MRARSCRRTARRVFLLALLVAGGVEHAGSASRGLLAAPAAFALGGASPSSPWAAAITGQAAAGDSSPWEALVAPPVPPLNPDSELLWRDIAWVDFRLAVAFFVVAPLLLLGAGLFSSTKSGTKDDEVLRVVSGYWQSSSLLLITVLLNLAGLQVGVITGFAAQVMIPISLWFWEDLNDAISAKGGAVTALFQLWRLVATAVAALGALAQVPLLGCAAAPALRADAACAPWLEAPLAFRDLLLPGLGGELAGQVGLLALFIYCGYLAYLVTFVLPRIGRSGLARRDTFTWLAPLQWLGLASGDR